MAREPTVRWNATAGRWMAWVRFPDGTQRDQLVEIAFGLKACDAG
jgi:hypothetical protein